MFDQITPLILTYNEAPNIGRTLEQLRWARDVVVVDSFSDDETLDIVSQFPNVRVFQRAFDTFAAQWAFGLNETGISTEWVLGLDADFRLTPELIDELRSLQPASNTHAFKAPLTYCIYGKPLRSSLLPPLTVLYRRSMTRFMPDGHTYRVVFDGDLEMLQAGILHDDRKSLSCWIEAQKRYTDLEGEKLLGSDRKRLSFPDKVRRLRVVAPVAIVLYCLIYRGGLLDGWPGIFYAFQRMFAEVLISLYLIENDLKLSGRQPETNPKTQDLEKPALNTPIAVAKQPDTIG